MQGKEIWVYIPHIRHYLRFPFTVFDELPNGIGTLAASITVYHTGSAFPKMKQLT